MASPAFVNGGTASQSAGATSLASIALPGSRVNGNLLFGLCFSFNNDTHTWTGTGWNKIAQQHSGAGFTSSLGYCIVDGSEAAPTVSWSGSVACACRLTQWTGTDGESPFDGANSVSTGTASPHTSTSVNSTRNESHVMYVDGCGVNTNLIAPAGWTEHLDTAMATAGGRITYGGKDIATSGSASGAISVVGGAAAWVQWQIELRSPAVSGGNSWYQRMQEAAFQASA